MRLVIVINDIVFCCENQKTSTNILRQFKFRPLDVTWGTQQGLSQQKIQYYFKLQHLSCQQEAKINKLIQVGIRFIPQNILIPFVYKKMNHLQKVASYLSSRSAKQNLLCLSKAQKICNSFPLILGNKINYDFFKSASGRVAANVGIIKKQNRQKIKTEDDLIQVDFSSFQPKLYQDYILKQNDQRDPYRRCQGQTKQQKKMSWFATVFSDKTEFQYVSPFGRSSKSMLVYHLQALQTDCMCRFIIQLDAALKSSKMLMFLFDGVLIDGSFKEVNDVLKSLRWQRVFPDSHIRYPFKMVNITTGEKNEEDSNSPVSV